jgi:hypothetical protein
MERLLSRDDQEFFFNCRFKEVRERSMRLHKQTLAVVVRAKELVGQYRIAPARLPGAIS